MPLFYDFVNDLLFPFRKVIETAVQADATIRAKYEAHREGFALLSQGPAAVAAALPSVTSTNVNSSSTIVLRLRKLMEDVETIKVSQISYLFH